MTTILGTGDNRFEEFQDWPQLPEGWSLHEVPDVVVDAEDRVHLLTRGEHPVLTFGLDGSFVRTWGEGLFTRAHGLTLDSDGNLWCVDDLGQCLRKCSPEGELLATIGTPGEPSPRHSGAPFNQPTKVALDPQTGDLFVADGYGNARVHRFSAEGEHIHSWGEYGTDPGQFNLVHSIATDAEGRVYVADRENHRVQIFDGDGTFLEQWNNMHRPCGMHVHEDRVYIGQLLSHLDVNADYPNIGACVTVHDLSGKRLARLGDVRPGEGPGQFTTPHGVAVDAAGNLYVAEVSWMGYGRLQDPPHEAPCFRKLVRVG